MPAFHGEVLRHVHLPGVVHTLGSEPPATRRPRAAWARSTTTHRTSGSPGPTLQLAASAHPRCSQRRTSGGAPTWSFGAMAKETMENVHESYYCFTPSAAPRR